MSIEHLQMLGAVIDELLVVGHEHRGGVMLMGQFGHEFDDAGASLGIQGTGRLVDDQYAGVVHEGPGDVDSLTLST